MSPEQLQGKTADTRSDLFSFGCVLYETLTGKRAFEGQSAASVIAAILEREPAPLEIARPLDRVVRRSLAKDPDQRFQTARDLKAALHWALEQPPAAAGSRRSSGLIWAVVAVLAAIGIAGWAAFWRATRPADRPLARLSVDLGPDAVAGQFTTVDISPDGTRLVFPIKGPDRKQVLATRLLSETKPTPLSGTEAGRDPFFSPDGKWIGFFADGKLKKISVQGGAPIVLCDAASPRGGSWGEDANIVAALGTGNALSRVPVDGGTPQRITKLQEGAISHRWPQSLREGAAVLFTLCTSSVSCEDGSIAAVSLKSGETKVLLRGGYFGRYLTARGVTGHLLYVHEGVLFGVPFDAERLELRGAAVPLLENLAADPSSGAGQFSFSATGNLVYRAGKARAQSWPVSWLYSSGKTESLIPTPGFYMTPRFSPDGRRLSLVQIAGGDQGIFVYDLQRDTMSRLALNTQRPAYPTWSPDGKHIVFRFSSAGGFSLGWIRADGAGDPQGLLNRRAILNPYSFFSDGRRLAYWERDVDNADNLWTMALDVGDPDHPKPGAPGAFPAHVLQ